MSYINVFDWRNQIGEVRIDTAKLPLFNPNQQNNAPKPPPGLSDVSTNTANIKTHAHINLKKSKS